LFEAHQPVDLEELLVLEESLVLDVSLVLEELGLLLPSSVPI
jgi:hypothetical protein